MVSAMVSAIFQQRLALVRALGQAIFPMRSREDQCMTWSLLIGGPLRRCEAASRVSGLLLLLYHVQYVVLDPDAASHPAIRRIPAPPPAAIIFPAAALHLVMSWSRGGATESVCACACILMANNLSKRFLPGPYERIMTKWRPSIGVLPGRQSSSSRLMLFPNLTVSSDFSCFIRALTSAIFCCIVATSASVSATMRSICSEASSCGSSQ